MTVERFSAACSELDVAMCITCLDLALAHTLVRAQSVVLLTLVGVAISRDRLLLEHAAARAERHGLATVKGKHSRTM